MNSIAAFLELYPNQNTKTVYRGGVYTFFEFIYNFQRAGRRVTGKEAELFEKYAIQYFNEDRDRVDDLMRFAAALHERPPLTAQSYIGGVREYFGYNGIEFTQRQLKSIRLKLPKGNSRTVESDLTSEVIRQILSHTDIKGRALFLTLASSGIRIGEALSIGIEDIKLDSEPALISIRGEYTKTGEQRFSFISKEAVDVVREWLKVRQKYLAAAKNKNKGLIKKGGARLKPLDDNRLFPFTDNTAQMLWTTALTNADLVSIDKVTNRKQLRLHQFRKFFRSQLALACPVDIVEALMGHSGYLTAAYRRFTKAQMAEFYTKGEHLLTITGNAQTIEEIKREITVETNEAIASLALENKQLKEDLIRLEKTVKFVAKVALEDPTLLPAMKNFLQD